MRSTESLSSINSDGQKLNQKLLTIRATILVNIKD